MAHLAVGEELDRVAVGSLDQAAGDERVGIHDATRREPGRQVSQVDDGELRLAAVGREAPLGQSTVERHLPALEARVHAASRAGLEALLTASGRLAEPRAPPTAASLAVLGR